MRHFSLFFFVFFSVASFAKTSWIEKTHSKVQICDSRHYGKFHVKDAKELLANLNCLEHPHLLSCTPQLLKNPKLRKNTFGLLNVLSQAAQLGAPVAGKKVERSIARSVSRRLARYGPMVAREAGKGIAKGLGVLLLPIGAIVEGSGNSLNCGEGSVAVDSSCRPLKRANADVLLKLDNAVRDVVKYGAPNKRHPKMSKFFNGTSANKCGHLIAMLRQSRRDIKAATAEKMDVQCRADGKTIMVKSVHQGKEYQTEISTQKRKKGISIKKIRSGTTGWFSSWGRTSADVSGGLAVSDDYQDILESEGSREAFHRMKMVTPLAVSMCEERRKHIARSSAATGTAQASAIR